MMRTGYVGYDYDYYSNDDDDDDDDGSSFEDCPLCDANYKVRNRQRHRENVHKCPYCNNYMPKTSIQTHIEQKHMAWCSYCNQSVLSTELQHHELTHFIKCKYCNGNVLKHKINAHIAEHHPFHATVGMIRKIDDEEFNRLVAENRIYAKDGHLFIK